MGERLIAAVLAGGEGRRMGGVKALRPFRGTTLLAHSVALARRWTDEVVVAVRDPAQASGATDAPMILDRSDIAGPLAGLGAALAYAQAQGAWALMTLPCDMPDLPEDLPAQLASAMRPGLNAVLPEVAGELQPACGLWRPAALAALHDYVASGRTSLNGFARAVGLGIVRFGADAAPAFANVNTPEALAALERRHSP